MIRRGFTLIEVMVVLSILAIIAILSYNFFGSVMKEATDTKHATEVFRQMQIIEDAYNNYMIQTGGVRPALGTDVLSAAFKDELVDRGILRTFPEPNPDWLNTDPSIECTNAYAPGKPDGWHMFYAEYAGTAATEFGFYLYCVKDSICKEFNRLYTDLGATIGPPHNDVELHGGRICSPDAYPDPDDDNLMMGISEVN